MPAPSKVNASYPKPRELYSKFITVARTDTTAFQAMWLPKDAILAGAVITGPSVSNAVTTATIGVGTTVASNQLISGFDVKTNGAGSFVPGTAAIGANYNTKLTVDTPVYAIYAETGTASTAGGPWVVRLDYFVTGPGEGLGQ